MSEIVTNPNFTINSASIKTLRQQTGAGILDCKKALQESQNDFNKAVEWLRKKGLSDAAKKTGRKTSEGLLTSYIHGEESRLAVLVEVNCETDFVARTDQFKEFVKNISLHIAASSPQYISEDEIPLEVKEKEEAILKERNANRANKKISKEDAQTQAQNLNDWINEVCLLKQKFVRNPKQTIEEYLKDTISRTGENIVIRRFVRWKLGE